MAGATSNRPKCLVEIDGCPLIEWQLEAMRSAGVEETGIVTGYLAESLSSFADRRFHNPNWATTNMVSTLMCAAAWLSTDVCVVSYSDIVYEAVAVTTLISASDSSIAITYDPSWRTLWEARFDDPLSDAETFALGGEGELLEIGSRPTSLDDVEGQYMGLLRISPEGWDVIQTVLGRLTEADVRTIHMTGLLNRIVSSGLCTVQCLPYEGRWAEVDSESDLEIASRLFRAAD
jgi:choline kinase